MNGNGLPAWVRAAAAVGVPAVISFLLLAMFAGILRSPVTETHALIRHHVRSDDVQIRLLRVICRQLAKSDWAMAQCDASHDLREP